MHLMIGGWAKPHQISLFCTYRVLVLHPVKVGTAIKKSWMISSGDLRKWAMSCFSFTESFPIENVCRHSLQQLHAAEHMQCWIL